MTSATPPKPVHTATDLTRPSDTEAPGGGEPKLPHERDQNVGMTDGKSTVVVEQARRDVESGIEDTSRGLETDKAYQKQK